MKFKYKAFNDQGKIVNGISEASNIKAASGNLRDQKLTPVSIKPISDPLDLNSLFNVHRVSSVEITNFTRQLSTMMTAGLPLTDALNLLRAQSSPAFTGITTNILADVQAGISLSEAIGKHQDVFPRVYVALIKAGEAAGVVETIMTRLADSMEKSREFISKVKGALVYPTIVMIGMAGVIVIMMVLVVPQLSTLYTQFDVDLPLATRIIVAMSNFMIYFWWLLIIMIVFGFLGLRAYIKSPSGRKKWDELLYKFPIIGPMLVQVMLTELTRTLALLVGAGVSIVESLNIVSGVVNNVLISIEIKRIAKRVEKGFPVSVSFSESGAFPPIVGQMVAVGEETGKIDEVLQKLSHYYETESEMKIKGLTTAIEPIIIIVLGLTVGFLIFSIIMPIYGILDHI
jgi:type II secretory pathway component PulF